MSTTGVPHSRALAYFAPVAAGHNKWVVERLNVGACVMPSRIRRLKHCAVREKRETVTQGASKTLDPHVFCKIKSRWAEDDAGEMNCVREWREGGVLIHRTYPLAREATF